MAPPLPLSQRSQRLEMPRAEYKKAFGVSCGPEGFSDENPDGIISLCVAENRLSSELVCERLARVPKMPEPVLHYGGYGTEKVAEFLSRYVAKREVRRDQVVLTSGASAAIDNLMYALCEAGDAVLSPAPGYGGFEDSTFKRAGVHLLSAELNPENGLKLTADLLESAWLEHGGENSGIRCLLLSNPANPSGEVLDEQTIRDIVSFARSHGLYTVMDEVYGAASVHGKNARFVSVAEALDNNLGDDVFFLWALSKDFCACGLRVGAVVTQRKDLQKRLSLLQLFGAIGRYTGFAVSDMLSDDEFLQFYITENQRRLADAYTQVTRMLDHDDVPYCEAQAGFFLLIDLRQFLDDEPSKDSEMRLFHRLVNEARVVLTPSCEMLGSSCYGFFRLCYGSVRDVATVKLAWSRIRSTLLCDS